MKNKEYKKYHESFLFRKRILEIEEEGLRITQNSFFNSEEKFMPIEQLGPYVQYQSKNNWGNIFMSIIMVLFGIKALTKSDYNDILFVVGVALIVGPIYWVIVYLSKIDYIGSYYFSYSTTKDKNSLEIKSTYPASEELIQFIEEIHRKQIRYSKESLIEQINGDTMLSHILQQAKSLKKKFKLKESEYNKLIETINKEFESKSR